MDRVKVDVAVLVLEILFIRGPFSDFAAVDSAPARFNTPALGEAVPHLEMRIEGVGSNALRLKPRVYVPSQVTCGGIIFTNVALHLKGNCGTFQPLDRKPSLTLNFDKFAKGQYFQGMDKLHLNNSAIHPS